MRPRLALLTAREWPRLSSDDRHLAAAFALEGVDGEPVVWDDPRVEWSSFAAVLVRSPWDRGEISFVFFRGAFSHAVIRHPRPGEILVDEHDGGNSAPFVPTAEQIAEATAIVDRVACRDCAYARLDLVRRPTTDADSRALALADLMLVDPDLFWRHTEGGERRFARAVRAWMTEAGIE